MEVLIHGESAASTVSVFPLPCKMEAEIEAEFLCKKAKEFSFAFCFAETECDR